MSYYQCDGLTSVTSEPHLYTAAVSLVRDPVVSFAASAYSVSLLIYYDCFLITVLKCLNVSCFQFLLLHYSWYAQLSVLQWREKEYP